MRWHLVELALVAAMFLPADVLAEPITATAVLTASRDNTLFAHPDGSLSNGAGEALFCGNNSQSNTRRTVLAFDVVAWVPSNATIDSVSLRLVVSSAPNDTPQRIAIHRLVTDWGEGTSVSSGGSGAASTSGDATWHHTFYPNQWWSTAGGDFIASESAASIVAADGPHTWASATLAADVQRWVDNPGQDFGWILIGDESAVSTVRRLDSREHPVAENRPTLTVHYKIEPTSIQTITWSALKAVYLHADGRSQ